MMDTHLQRSSSVRSERTFSWITCCSLLSSAAFIAPPHPPHPPSGARTMLSVQRSHMGRVQRQSAIMKLIMRIDIAFTYTGIQAPVFRFHSQPQLRDVIMKSRKPPPSGWTLYPALRFQVTFLPLYMCHMNQWRILFTIWAIPCVNCSVRIFKTVVPLVISIYTPARSSAWIHAVSHTFRTLR